MKKTLRHFTGKTYLLFFMLLIGSADLSAQILTNGDFESGGSGVGFFVHDYTLINPLTGTSNPGFYARTTDPALMNSNYNTGGDHTTGTGNMLVFDGSTSSNRFFWTTGDTGGAIGGFTAGTTYTFSFWIKSVSDEVTSDDATRASIGIFFVNANNINPANQNFLAPLPSEGWVNIQYSFVATADNVMVRLKTNTPGPVGSDFAVDDFSINVGGLPFVGSYTSVNPTCPSGMDGSIAVNLTGGTLPYTAYSLTGDATQTNTNGIFEGLGEGTYTITVSDSDGEEYTQTGIVLVAPNALELSDPVTICSGESTVLMAEGGTGSYNWTASPEDTSITDPNSTTQTVSPTVTTTYTVTSGSVSDPENLIENSDFSQGNTLFITEYTQVADPNPFGVQSSYDVVTNPNAWFTAFSSCGDHTTGSGNMMVFDGSTVQGVDVIVWSNQNPITVIPNTDYTFSYYVASVSPDSPAQLEVTINGVSQGDPVAAPGETCLWTEVSYNWNSGANTTVDFAIYNANFSGNGNDFALDDITFKETITCLYEKTVTVTVNPGTTPTFDAVAAICSGEALSALPTTSNNGVTGTWLPALDNTATTTYTFTPDAGQCASSTDLTITVNQPSVPTFDAVAPICSGEALNALPATSNEGITGVWSPELDNTMTTTYTFTPTAGQCALVTTLTIEVNTLPDFTISEGCDGVTYILSAVQNNTSNSLYAWFDSTGTQIGTEASVEITTSGVYELVITEDGCSAAESINVLSASCGGEIQRGISPNDDGLNDYFDLEAYNVKQLQIFNRYGMNVYTKANYQNEWHGQSDNGNELPDGTYFYVIDFADSKSKTGWIYSNRER